MNDNFYIVLVKGPTTNNVWSLMDSKSYPKPLSKERADDVAKQWNTGYYAEMGHEYRVAKVTLL